MADNKKPQYAFLPRKLKDVIDYVKPKQMYQLLEAGYDTEFCYILGIIADMKQTCGQVSSDHELILQVPRMDARASRSCWTGATRRAACACAGSRTSTSRAAARTSTTAQQTTLPAPAHRDFENPKNSPRRGPYCGAPTPTPVPSRISYTLSSTLMTSRRAVRVPASPRWNTWLAPTLTCV